MLPSENKLKGQRNFDEIKKKGKLYQRENFSVSILNKKNAEKPKFGIIVSTKISSVAVNRNRIKRAIFEAIRRNLDQVPSGFIIAFLIKRSMAKMTTDEIMRQVESFIRNLNFNKKRKIKLS